MKKYYIILLLTSLYAILTSCTSHDDVIAEPEDGVYQFDLVISVARQNGMRMTNEVIQAENQPFRGLQSLTAIPYITNGPVTANDEAKTSTFTRAVINRIDIDGGYHYYLVVNCSFAKHTNHLLVYAQASTVPGMATDTQNGKLIATLSETADQKPSAFSFSLKSIRETEESHAEAKALAEYMTTIANTPGWSTTTNSVLLITKAVLRIIPTRHRWDFLTVLLLFAGMTALSRFVQRLPRWTTSITLPAIPILQNYGIMPIVLSVHPGMKCQRPLTRVRTGTNC